MPRGVREAGDVRAAALLTDAAGETPPRSDAPMHDDAPGCLDLTVPAHGGVVVPGRASQAETARRRARKNASQEASCSRSTYSSGPWAWAMSPGPTTTAGIPACS